VAKGLPNDLQLLAGAARAVPAAAERTGRIAGHDRRIARAAAGDRQAAAELLGELLPRVRNLVRFLCPGDSEVDDHSQAALIEILRALPGFEGRSALTTWADRITVRVTLRRVRKSRSQQASLQPLDEGEIRDSTPPPDGSAMTRRQLAEMLDRLPEPQRQVLVLHHLIGMSVPEVAEALEVPFETARSRLRLATGRLRALCVDDGAADD